MSHNQSKKQSFGIPHQPNSGLYRAARLDGRAKNRGIKNIRKPSMGR